jgi:hypothetical protein
LISFKQRYLSPKSITNVRNAAFIFVCKDSDFLFDAVMAISNIFPPKIMKN